MKRFEEDTMKPWDIGEIERMGFVKEEMSSGERCKRRFFSTLIKKPLLI